MRLPVLSFIFILQLFDSDWCFSKWIELCGAQSKHKIIVVSDGIDRDQVWETIERVMVGGQIIQDWKSGWGKREVEAWVARAEVMSTGIMQENMEPVMQITHVYITYKTNYPRVY